MKRIILWIMQTKPYIWALKHIVPYVRFTTYYPKLSGTAYHSAHDVLRPGDFIVCVDERKLTSLLIPGEFSHALFCIGKHPTEAFEVIEMTHDDCVKRHLFETFKESDRVVILRADKWTEEDIMKAIQRAHEIYTAKVPYDHQFTLGVKALYCSELCMEVDVDGKLNWDLEDLAGLGQPYLSPDGVYWCEDLSVVWDSGEVA